jgi:hypothetical protein
MDHLEQVPATKSDDPSLIPQIEPTWDLRGRKKEPTPIGCFLGSTCGQWHACPCMHMYVCVCVCVCIYIYIYIYIHAYMCVCVCVCICIYIICVSIIYMLNKCNLKIKTEST